MSEPHINGTAVREFYMYIYIYIYIWWYVRTSPARASIYIVYTVRDIFQHQLRGRMKELLRVTCKGIELELELARASKAARIIHTINLTKKNHGFFK